MSPNELKQSIEACMLQDRRRFQRRLRRLKGRRDQAVREAGLRKLIGHVEDSMARVERRRQSLVKQEFKTDLPILEFRVELAKAIRENQVVIVCGETGSGKTTQLPRICLDIGRGLFGMIGHTQPRRLAARSVAHRLVEECGPDVSIGFQVRFKRTLPEETIVKVMTDGILLAELADDPRLEKYDTIIIDEAHERSLNIDLLMGCLKGILARRPELRVIVTSATIDSQRFSEFFDDAPVFEVSGRQFPVEIIHARTGDSPDDPEKTTARVCECMGDVLEAYPDDGDVLVFLPGEREIRDLSKVLHGSHGKDFDVVPLYARLSLSAQQKALRPGSRRRIVLSTNVAETSLTVPGIRVVIDSGLVRINRFSARRGINRLPVEGVSVASANQRAGRAGRIAPGTCYRLYSEGALQRRDPFTAPEVMRTNLSSLILRLAELGFTDIDSFPLLDRPRPAAVRAGLETLHDLGALDTSGGLTSLGRSMAKLPVDPRIARILLSAQAYGCLDDILVIASALAISDPRLRPPDQEDQAAQRHAAFKVEGSDFLSLRALWRSWSQVSRQGQSRRRWCRENFLSWVRMLEWREIHDQLRRMLRESGIRSGGGKGDDESIHRALLSGLVANVGSHSRSEQETDPAARKNKGVYDGPGRRRFRIHPSSDLSGQRPDWIVAAEIVETTRLWARRVAKVEPDWIVEAASHLLEPVHGDASWDSRRGSAVTTEKRVFRGLMVPGSRIVSYAVVDPYVSRQMFIEDGLVRNGIQRTFPFLDHNRKLQDRIEASEARLRRRDLLVSEIDRCAFYEARIPMEVVDLLSFTAWLESVTPQEADALRMQESDLLRRTVEINEEAFPPTLDVHGCSCEIRYGFEPGSAHDGMCIRLPLALLRALIRNSWNGWSPDCWTRR
ncbi:MAG: ATP-dependent RNA helicase HrpA [Phycisphaerae bacterium]|nr:ATP-dependent RNA helicase HrpA [Phycisphaerae bacterium]